MSELGLEAMPRESPRLKNIVKLFFAENELFFQNILFQMPKIYQKTASEVGKYQIL